MAVLYRWVDDTGDRAILREHGIDFNLAAIELRVGEPQFLSRDQARELAAALLKWAGPASKEELQAAIEDIARSGRPMIAVPASPPPNTVRVRAGVAVAPDGSWDVTGFYSWNDDEVRESLNGTEWSGQAIHFIEAYVPLPVPQTIEGRVVQ